MFIKLEDKNLYILNALNNNIVVTYNNTFPKQKIKVKTYKDKNKNTFSIVILNDNMFCVRDISIKQLDLIQNILTPALFNHETNNLQHLFLYRLVINSNKSLNYEFGRLVIKTKNNFYDISIIDITNPNNSVTFKLYNNVTFYTNLAFKKLQINGSIIFEFNDFEKVRYLQIKNERIYVYFPVNETYKIKLFDAINELLAKYV